MSPYRKEIPAPVSAHQERIRRATAAVFANAATHSADYPAFHLAPPSGWMNDPNGLIYFRNRYHVFYQHFPYRATFGRLHWGHASSADLIRWEHHPLALAPGNSYDKNGCFSGCAVEHNDRLYLFYTGHNSRPGASFQEAPCLASSADGIHFEKHGLVAADPPPDAASDFRDPKVWREDGQWLMLAGYGRREPNGEARGCLALYRSPDLENWAYLKTLFRDSVFPIPGQKAHMLECPDFFSVDETHILLCSPQGPTPRGHHFRNVFHNGSIAGAWENLSFSPSAAFRELDAGHDFHAAQTMAAPDGRRLLIAWFDMWETAKPTARQGWAGMLTLPRELFMWHGRVCMRPAKEMKNLRLQETVHCANAFVADEITIFNRPDYKKGLEIYLVCDLRRTSAAQFGVRITSLRDPASHIVLYADRQSRRFVADRNSLASGPKGIRSCPLPASARMTLRMYIDHTSIEAFMGNGRIEGSRSLSSRFYFGGAAKRIDFFTIEGGVHLERLSSWELQAVTARRATLSETEKNGSPRL